jgi:3' terminal RNA ribose 2'-O-methyltransferase Hen1
MLLTISTTHRPATDLGFLLHKNPNAVRTVGLSFGDAHVFYPEASDERCTVALLLEVDPVALVRRKGAGGTFALAQYVNDRPYATSSMTSVAIAKLFGTAMSGRSDDRPELAASALPLEVEVPVLPAAGGADLVGRLFGPLGYEVDVTPIALDPQFPTWGDSRYVSARLRGDVVLKELLAHLYLLLPVLDNDKHYWVDRDELEKLLVKGGDWLAAHPERELITARYLRHRSHLTKEALSRLLEEDQADVDESAARHDHEESEIEERISLRDQRLGSIVAALRASRATSVIDLGCGEGRLLRTLIKEPALARIVGMDVSSRVLRVAANRMHMDQMTPRMRERVQLFQGSLTYRDARLAGFDAAVLMEVIEHLDPPRLDALERCVFAEAAPGSVIVTTPNVEYNVRFDGLAEGKLRHRDHRFEWTRAEFADWGNGVADRHGYAVRYLPVGDEDPDFGSPTQMAVFSR